MTARPSPEAFAGSTLGGVLLHALETQGVLEPSSSELLIAATEIVDEFLDAVDAAPTPAVLSRRLAAGWDGPMPALESALSCILPALELVRREGPSSR